MRHLTNSPPDLTNISTDEVKTFAKKIAEERTKASTPSQTSYQRHQLASIAITTLFPSLPPSSHSLVEKSKKNG